MAQAEVPVPRQNNLTCRILSAIVQKLWNYCNVLRDAGLSYGDYLEQLTYLLFLKMAHERTESPFNQSSIIPAENDWPSLFEYEGIALEHH